MKALIQKGIIWLKEHSLLLKLVFLASVMFFVINQITQIVQGMTWQDLKDVLASLGTRRFLLLTGGGCLAVTPILVYDWVTVKVLETKGKTPSSLSSFVISAWTTDTINNLAGFGGVVGATLRANFFGKGLDQRKVIATVSKVAFFMFSGLSILSLFTLLDMLIVHPNNPYQHYWLWLLAGSCYAPALVIFIYLKRTTLFQDLTFKRVVQLLAGSTGQWLCALLFFLSIGYLLEVPAQLTVTGQIQFLWQIYPLFVVATLIGMLSMVPGGMGTFDVLLILGLGQIGIQRELAVAWLLYYRLFYYLIPFISGLGLLLHRTGAKINRFFNGLPKILSQRSAHAALVVLLYFAGIMMVLLSTVPNLSNISRLFSLLLPFSFDFLDQTLNMLVGVLLLGLARGIAAKVQKAYLPTLLLLLFCILNTILRTFSWSLSVFYILVFLSVYLSRKEFYRIKFVYSWGAALFDCILLAILFILYSIVGYFTTDAFEHITPTPNFLLFPSEDIWFSGLIGLILSLITLRLLFGYLTGEKQKLGLPFEKQRAANFLKRYGGNSTSHYLFLKDRKCFYYQEGGQDKVLFQFQRRANKCFVLGDPLGDPSKWEIATLTMMKQADRLGYQLAFYEISDRFAMLLHNIGFDFVKIGEEAMVDLTQQQMGKINLQSLEEKVNVHRLKQDGYWFELVQSPLAPEIVDELERVSQDWLKGHSEKYFSYGQFKREYINQAPVGIMRTAERRIVGFITVKPIGQNETCSYDLLRWSQEAPLETRDFLLIELFAACQNQDYQWFNLGLAPLYNVGNTRFSFLEERILNVIYHYGPQGSSLQENRQFKEQFVSCWEARYLAHQKHSFSYFTLLQLMLLISRGRRYTTTMEKALLETD